MKNPELTKMLDAAKAEKAELVAKVAPLRERREALIEKIRPLEKEQRAIEAEIKAINGNKLFELDNTIAALHRALGPVKSMPAEQPGV